MPENSWPALQLLATAAGAVARGRSLPLGGVVPLDDGITIGTEGDVRVAAAVQPQHCRIEPKGGGIKLWHYGQSSLTSVNGRPAGEACLTHRDLIGLTGGTLFRLLERPEVVASDPLLEKEVEARPEADGMLLVWADWLLEQGDELGARIAAARRGEILVHEPWLEVWAAHFVAGRLDVAWHLGLANRVAVREVKLSFASVGASLNALLSLRVMRFVRELRVELISDRGAQPADLESLATVAWPRTLERLHLGDVPDQELEQVELWRAALAKRLARPVEVGVFHDAELEVITSSVGQPYRAGERVEIGDRMLLGRAGLSTQTGLILGGSYLVRRERYRYMLEQVVAGAEPMRVNGRSVQRFPLRDADLIELGNEFTARFVLRR